MEFAFHGLLRPIKTCCCLLAVCLFAVSVSGVPHDAATAEKASAGASPRKRLELLVRGSPLADSTTTMATDAEYSGEMEAQPVSQMGAADRFRLIVQSEREKDDSPVTTESVPVLHPMKKANLGRPAGRKGLAAKAALGLAPTAALFSQVLLGSRMKADVLEDKSYFDTVDFYGDTSAVDETKWAKAKKALTSKTAIGITAAIAALATLYLSKEAWDHWKGPKQFGLLTPKTAKWDLDNCLLIVDVHGAEDSGSLQGKYIAGSAFIKVEVNTQRATLSYSRIPSVSKSFWKSIFRKREVVHEHFSLPAEHCYVSSSNNTTATAAKEAAAAHHNTERSSSVFIREYKEKTFFRRERVAALAVKVQKSPGPQPLKKSAADPGPPPRDLLDAIQLKHQTTGVNAVEVEESPTAAAAGLEKDPAVQALERLVADPDICGGSVLCVDSVSIAANKNLCTVHAAVDDIRPIAVLADVPQQILSIVVGSTNFDASEEGLSRATAAEFQIALPRHCAIGEGSRAVYTVAPFTVQVDDLIDFGNAAVDFDEGLGGDTTLGDEDIVGALSQMHADVGALPQQAHADGGALSQQVHAAEKENAGVIREGEGEVPTSKDLNGGSEEREGVQEGADALEEAEADEFPETRKEVKYQHVRIQFRPLRSSDLTVTLNTLPERQLGK